jgi:2-C-methyl-D-erythritol 4-phosphate cytidylyltransferase
MASSADGRAGVVVVAGGSGRRMGGPLRKQYLELLGQPVLLRAIRPFLDHPDVRSLVVVLPEEDVENPPSWLTDLPVRVAAGGAERGDSVWNGLRALPDDADPVLIHDGARPLVSADVIDRVLDGARAGGAVAAIPLSDTVKEVDDEGRIVATPDRARLWRAQTPQGFPRSLLVSAYRRAREEGVNATDDASLLERYGHPIRVVLGSSENLKITHPADLRLAELVVRGLLD